jgi:hypothetical protein
LFDRYGIYDFEAIKNELDAATPVCEAYGIDKAICESIIHDSERLKDILIDTITRHHIDVSTNISQEQFDTCGIFLQHFNMFFTSNYDLLTYWVLLNQDRKRGITCNDGFYRSSSGELIWDPDENGDEQTVFYLHGALHYFISDFDLHKARMGAAPLIEVIRNQIRREVYPLIVSEGNSSQKLKSINKIKYLKRSITALQNGAGSLFIHGFSFSNNDQHICNAIGSSRYSNIFVSLYDNAPDEHMRIMEKVHGFCHAAGKNCGFYFSSTANVWMNGVKK